MEGKQESSDEIKINDAFPDEEILAAAMEKLPWYADYANYVMKICVEKEKGRTLDGIEQELAINHVKNCAPDTYIMNISDGMMEIDKPVNVVGYLKCVNCTKLEELCLLKENFKTSDGTELNCYVKDCAPKICIIVRSDKMIEIENPKNINDTKDDRQWVVKDAAEHEEMCIKKQKVESLDGVELDCCAIDQVKTRAPKSVDGVGVKHCPTNHEPDTIEGVEPLRPSTTHRPNTQQYQNTTKTIEMMRKIVKKRKGGGITYCRAAKQEPKLSAEPLPLGDDVVDSGISS
ncbi:hypothetical protein FXO38_26382 [Capsicum annuum]|nr:hypothetical protein FXO38_26382 [Capsicum annuum]KAF3678509.1 hypothetical protein FXO37_04345 [Capsicum annuum]